MCFVLDVNSFHRFFNRQCHDFYDFEPLYDWLHNTDGTKLVYGGTTFVEEIKKLPKYIPYLTELRKMAKFKEIDTTIVDNEEKRLKMKVRKKDFDDPHIVALLAISGCLIFASHDKRADKYIKDKSLYPKKARRPSIYRKRPHCSLLSKDKIVSLKNVIR